MGSSSNDGGNFTNDQAQAFTTGSNSGGYSLTKVVIASNLSTSADFTVSVHENDSGAPGTSLGTLTNPTLPATGEAGNYEFTHSGIDLAASTTYFIVVDVSTSSSFNVIHNTDSDAEDTGGATGWSIGDSSLYRGFGSTGSWTTWAQSKKISITGTVKGATTNSPATAGPTITGFPQLGKTLTADASTIVDPDGTTGATFTYQWVRSDDGTDTDINSATATTYTLVEADVGKLIKVKVSYTDDDDMDETATSEPVGPVGRRVIDSAGNVDAKGVWFETVIGGDFIIRLSDDEDDQVYGYTTGPITHSLSHGFDLHADNGDAKGIAAADGVLYVADSGDDKLFAYNVGATGTFGERLTSKEFALHANNQEPAGVWTDGETLYVVDPDEDKLYAYNVGATGTFGASLTDKDVPLHADNDDPWGVWSTGTVIWVADRSDYFIYAYSLSADGVRLDDQRPDNSYWEWALDTTDNNTDPWGMWSNDDNLWVLDDVGSKLFAYYLPLPSEPAPPTGVDITTEGNGELTVGWTAPTDDGGSAITGYTVQYRKSSDTAWTAHAHAGTATTTTITGLEASTSYQVHVLAKNAEGTSDWSASGTGSTGTSATGALISNVGQTAATGAAQVSTSQSQAQGFTTGSDSGGYTLGSVELAVSSFSGTASDITVSIYSESSGDPGTVVHTLTTPASISAAVTTFTAPSGATLAASTTYYVVISTTSSGISLSRTDATAEDTGGVSGWSIADSRRFFGGSGWNTTTNPIRMRINGDAATSTNSPATGAPTISGTPAVGELLTADISNIGDADGIADADFEYQWIAFDGTTDSDISGATGETYRPLLAHLNQTIKVRVTFDDDDDNAESLTSAPTAAVTASTYGQVIWAATLTVEEETVAAGTFFGFSLISDRGSLEPYTFTHDGNSTTVTALQYLEGGLLRFTLSGNLGSADFNLYLDGAPFLIEPPGTAFEISDHGLTWTDEQMVEVRLTVNRAATGAPAITGTPEVGETLTASISAIMDEDGVPAAAQFAYQWISDDGTDDIDIDGATDSTYTLVQADAGKSIKVRVSFTDNAKFPESLTSAATTAVTVPVAALVSNVGQTATGNANVTASQSQGQGFTTGSDSGGYTLGSVELAVSSFSGAASDITVSIYSESSGDPGTVVHTLTTPASISTPVTTFTAPSGTTLAANTTYYVVISTTGSGINLSRTNAAAEDTGGASGWSIADDRRLFAGGNWVNTTNPIRMRVNGATTSTDIWSATLTVAEFTIEPNTYRGYTHVGTAVGELDPSTFSHDGDEITVNNLWHIVGGLLTFEISQELGGEGFLLRLGETLLPLGEPTGDPPVYQFSDHGVSWSVGDTVEVRLIPNQAATGAPVITGTPEVSQTLTADTDGIGDPDGIDNADFSYQWISDDSDIDGATDSTYTLVQADAGKSIKVRVSFTDDGKFPESLTSAAVTVPVAAGETALVSNTGQSNNGYNTITSTTPKRAQAFTTGTNELGYRLSSIGISFGTISSDSNPTSELTATLNKVDGSNPGDVICTLTDPASYVASSVNTYQAPAARCPTLTASTTYFFVISRANDTTSTIQLDRTNSNSEDADPAVGWSIADSRRFFTNDAWTPPGVPSAHRIAVTGAAVVVPPPTEVPADWSLVPSGLQEGDQFRLLFISSAHRNASPSAIATYNTWVQDQAASGHTDIQDYSSSFRAVGSTEDMDARDNTYTTYTSSDKGVAIYWLGGNKVADDYEDFYDEDWDEEAAMKNESGTAETGVSAWTGSDHDGTEMLQGTPETSRALGNSNNAWVRFGKTDSASHGPLSGETAARGGNKRIYGLSSVFEVVAANNPATGAPTITGTAQVGELLTADASNIGDPDGIAGATFSYQWIADDGTTDSDIDGATGETYWPSAGDVGNTIKVKVSFTDDEDNAESVTSAATGAVAGPAVTAVPADWSLIPDGLDAGDRFRLLFLSSDTRTAEPTDIGDYNTWIQDRVDAGHADIQDHTETFRAVGCTAAVDARDDTGTTYTSDDKGVPIYWLNGDKAADEYEDFYDETWDEEASMRDELGSTVSAPASVWTGCGHDGTERFGAGRSLALGGFSVIYGVPNSDATNAGPLSSSNSTGRTGQRPFYGLSGVFSVSPPGEVLYSATLTVGETTFGLDTYLGYHNVSNQGSLHPVSFTYAGSLVRVDELDYVVGGDLKLSANATGSSLLSSGSFNLYLDGAAFLIEDPASDSDREFEFSNHGLSWTNGQIVRVWLTENREPKLTISGTTLVGQTLTATIDEPDGLPPSDQITYQWIRVDGNTESDISGETGSTYTLVDADEGKTIKVEASYTDNANFAESLTSDATAVISSGPSVGTVTSGMITQTSAVITVTIANPDTNTQTVNLQYKRNADTNWTSDGTRSTVSAAVTFTLSSLTGNTDYDVRASLDSTFDSGVVTAAFKTSPVKPAPPTGVDITTEGNGELTVGWTAPTENGGSAITGYKVQWKSGAQSFGSSRQHTTADGAATSYTIPSLTNGTEYTVRVLAVNSVGDSAASNTDTGTPSTTPSAPTNVLASGNAELTVTWDAPDDGGSAITGYTVQWKSGTQSYSTSRQATVTTTTHTIPSLTNDTTYTLRVKATNAFGDSDWTETTGTPVSGPGVASVTVDQASITQTLADVTVTVANPQNTVQVVFVRYRVAGDAWPSAPNLFLATSGSGTAVTFTLSGLTGNTAYDVAASLDETFASGVKTASFTTSPTKPGKTEFVNVTFKSDGSLLIAWTAPSNDGGSAITGYTVQWKSGSQGFGDPSREHTTGASAITYAITGLTNGTEYTVRVIAVNAVGDGPPSDTTTGTPVGPPDAPPNVQAGSGHQQLTVSWGAPNDGGSAITEYTLQWKSGGQSFSSSRQRTIAAPSRTDTIPSLINGTEYTVRVRATTALGDSDWSAEAKGTPREGPHVSLVKVKEPVSCTVSFVALEFANLDTATEYQAHLRFRAQGSSSWTVLSPQGFWSSGLPSLAAGGALNGPSPAFTLTDLAYETTYDVQAALDSGFVDGLATTTFSTPNLSEVGLTPLSPGDGTLGLRMTRPTSEGRVDGYLLQWKSGDEEYDDTDTSERQADVPGSGDREYTITGLDNGVEYTVRAMAYNDNGVGVPSSEVRGTPEAPPNSPARGAPTISGTAQVGETLTADTGGIEDDDGLADAVYSYQWLADDADIAGATSDTYTPVADDVGKAIKVKVSFRDDRNHQESLTSAATAAVEADPDAPTEPPNAPRTVRIVGDTNTSLTLTWDAPDGGTAVTEYRVQWLTVGEGFANARRDGREAVVDASARSHTITGLTGMGSTRCGCWQ